MALKTFTRSWRSIFSKALIRPFKLFFREPIIQLLGIYMAFIYGTLYCTSRLVLVIIFTCADFTSLVFLTTIPAIFETTYGEDVGIAGLNYFALGVGLTGASQVNARMLDKIYKYFQKKNGGVGKPEYRLRMS